MTERDETYGSTDSEQTTRLDDGTEAGTEAGTRDGTEATTFVGQWQGRQVEEDEDADSPFHPLQTGYLVVGLLAIGLALMWLLTDQGVMDVGDGGVAFSIVLIASGLVALVASLGRSLRRR